MLRGRIPRLGRFELISRRLLPVSFVAGLLFVLLVSQTLEAALPPDSLAIAAEYYFTRQDYPQALSLWSEVLKRKPDNVAALLRVAELKLLSVGRTASRDVLLGFLDGHANYLPTTTRIELKEKLGTLQSTFLSDEGQSVFLRALPKIRRQDCAGAMTLLTQASGLEVGNLRVLQEKARCEKSLGMYDRFYETLKLAYDSDPFDEATRENLLEAQIYFGEPAKAVAAARRDPEAMLSVRERIAFAVALALTGADADATRMLVGLLGTEKSTGASPAVLYTLGKISSGRTDGGGEAISYFERFLALVSRPENMLVDGWDAYRVAEKIEPVKKLVASLKSGRPTE